MTSDTLTRQESTSGDARFVNDRILAHAFQAAPNQPLASWHLALRSTEPQAASAPQPAGGSERQLQDVLQQLPVGVILLNSRGLVDYCNQFAELLLGDGLVGRRWRDVIADKFQPRHDDGHEISLENGRRISVTTRSLEEQSGQLIVLNDLTETRVLQEKLSRHQRLSAMGRMVSSLAHQLRTPLSAALLYAEKLSKGAVDPQPASTYGGKILSRLQTIDRQIRDMLVFVRGETELRDEVSLERLQAELSEAASDIPNPQAARLAMRPATGSARLRCNRDALLGALLNLIENAFQASSKGQLVTVALERLDGESGQGSVRIRVEDEGAGIEQTLLEKLDEPFVTTKANGTGLGLAVVKQVSRAHGGSFSLLRRAGSGMCAEMVLPLVAEGQAR